MEKTEHAVLDSTKRYSGIIINLNVERNFGFIRPDWTAEGDDDNIFFHINNRIDLATTPYIQVGGKVSFGVREDDHGVPMAYKLEALTEGEVLTTERPNMPDSKTIKIMRKAARDAKKAARKIAKENVKVVQTVAESTVKLENPAPVAEVVLVTAPEPKHTETVVVEPIAKKETIVETPEKDQRDELDCLVDEEEYLEDLIKVRKISRKQKGERKNSQSKREQRWN